MSYLFDNKAQLNNFILFIFSILTISFILVSCHLSILHPSIHPSVRPLSITSNYLHLLSCPVLSCPLISSPLSYYSFPPPPLSLNPCLLPFQTLTDFTSSFSLFLSSSLIPLSLFHSPGFDFDFSLHNLQTFIHLYTTFIFISCLLYFSHYSSARSSVHLFSGS